ncbi:hypothetical protein BKA70DRAFT_1405332 [Coprinopsis sp. MPI-PUGE-AT-0042]|nr:hypothetical protein BKA70DRAFT_1405332 [Coprinopsis sp. MPI-PUGE-AT-0042]
MTRDPLRAWQQRESLTWLYKKPLDIVYQRNIQSGGNWKYVKTAVGVHSQLLGHTRGTFIRSRGAFHEALRRLDRETRSIWLALEHNDLGPVRVPGVRCRAWPGLYPRFRSWLPLAFGNLQQARGNVDQDQVQIWRKIAPDYSKPEEGNRVSALAASAVGLHTLETPTLVPKHTSILNGQLWFDEILNRDPERFQDQLSISHITELVIAFGTSLGQIIARLCTKCTGAC